VLLHAVTGPAAVQLLVAYVSSAVVPIAFAYAWQAVAAWAAAFSSGYDSGPPPPTDAEWNEIVDLAVDSDEHAHQADRSLPPYGELASLTRVSRRGR
jgi:hypothetical protein